MGIPSSSRIGRFSLAGGLLLFAAVAPAAETWWSPAWDFRIPLVVKEKQGIDHAREPVVVSGSRLVRAIGLRGIRLSSLRLVDAGRELPLQTDEKDMTGAYQFAHAGNDLLDDDDELVFQLTLKPNESRRLYLYGDSTRQVRPAHYDSDLEIRQNLEANRNYDLALVNQRLTVGIRSGRNTEACGGLGRGAVTLFQFDGTDRVTQGHAWGWFLFGSPLQELPWGEPLLLTPGPVRAIVAVKALGVDQKIGGQTVRGDVFRYFILYNGIPHFVFQEKLPAKFAEPPFQLSYTLPFQPCALPRDWVRERLYAPDAQGKVTVLDYKSEMRALPPGGPGWFAFHHPQRRTGLAVLYPAAIKSGQAHLCAQGKARIPEVLKTAWGANNGAVEAGYTVEPPVAAGAEYACAILGLDQETPEQLGLRLTALLKSPLGNEIEIQPLEVLP